LADVLRPDRGTIRAQQTTRSIRMKAVQAFTANLSVLRRPASGG